MQITKEDRLKFIKEIIGKSYCTLHTHSEYSNIRLRDSINRIKEMLINANDKGLNGLCLTDHELIAGHFELLSTMKELKEDKKIREDFKVMLGNEIYLVDNDLEELKTKGRFPHFLLIAKDKVGHMALRELTNQAWENYFVRGGMERVPVTYDQMANIISNKYKGHLVASTACLGGAYAQAILDLIMYETMLKHKEEEIEDVDIESREFQLLLSRYLPHRQAFIKDRWDFIDAFNKTIDRRDLEEIEIVETMIPKMKDYYIKKIEKLSIEEIKEDILNSKKEIHRFIQYCINVFGKEDFYIEIQPSTSNDQVLFNAKGLEIAKAYGLEYIVTTDAHFANKEDITIQEAFLNAQEGDREVLAFYLSCYIQTPEEVIEHLDYISLEDVAKSMENTNIIADKCGNYDLYEQLALFEAEVRTDFVFDKDFIGFLEANKNKYEYVERFLNADNDYDKYLLYLSIEGLKERSLDIDHTHIDRIEKELTEIKLVSEGLRENMSNYYLSTREFVEIMWKVSLVGAGRGSVTGLFIAYLLGITQVNPLIYDLPYTRHIHHSKISLADVDIDTSAIARGKILDLMKEEYGQDNVVNIGTFGTEGTKSTVQTACRGLGVDDGMGDFLSSLVPVERGSAWSLKDIFEGNEEKERKPVTEFVNEVQSIPNLKETMFRIEGLINKRSVHASGVFFLDKKTEDRLIVMRSRNGQKVTQYDMKVAEDTLGLVKYD